MGEWVSIEGAGDPRVRHIAFESFVAHGRGVLRMLEHTLPARERAQEALRVFNQALRGAVLLEGEWGEASDLVAPLLETLDQGFARAAGTLASDTP